MARKGKTELFSQWQDGRLVITDQGFSTGKRVWVHNGDGTDSTSYGYSPDAPFASLAYVYATAARLTSAGSDLDTIYVMPGHAETLSGTGALTLNITGVQIIGLGTEGDRPTFTFTSSAATDIDITGANTKISNVIFKSTLTGTAVTTIAIVDVDAAGVEFHNCSFRDVGTACATKWIDVGTAADDFKMINCQALGSITSTSAHSFMYVRAGADRIVVDGLHSVGIYSAGNICFIGACADVLFEHCKLDNRGTALVTFEGFSGLTGFVNECYMHTAGSATATLINTAGSLVLGENYGTWGDGKAGKLLGTAST